GGHAHQHHRAGQVTGVERLPVGLGTADGLDDDVGAEAAGELPDRLHGVGLPGVDGVRGAHGTGGLQLTVVDVDGDDLRGARQPGTRDRRVADAAAADDGDGVAAADLAGVDRGTDAGHHPAAQQPGDGRGDGRVDLGALPGGDQRLLGEGADAQGRGQFGAVGQGHLLPRVVRVEAVPGASAQTGPARAAHRTPVEDDEVTGGDVGDAVAHRLHHAGRLVAEQEREVAVDAALLVVQVGVAHTAGLDLDDRLARPRVGYDDRLDAYRLVLARRDHAAHFLRHADSFVRCGHLLLRPYD